MAHLAQTLDEAEIEVNGETDGQSSSSSDEAEIPHRLVGKSFTVINLNAVSHHAKQVCLYNLFPVVNIN